MRKLLNLYRHKSLCTQYKHMIKWSKNIGGNKNKRQSNHRTNQAGRCRNLLLEYMFFFFKSPLNKMRRENPFYKLRHYNNLFSLLCCLPILFIYAHLYLELPMEGDNYWLEKTREKMSKIKIEQTFSSHIRYF